MSLKMCEQPQKSESCLLFESLLLGKEIFFLGSLLLVPSFLAFLHCVVRHPSWLNDARSDASSEDHTNAQTLNEAKAFSDMAVLHNNSNMIFPSHGRYWHFAQIALPSEYFSYSHFRYLFKRGLFVLVFGF